MNKDIEKIEISRSDLIRLTKFIEESNKLFHQQMRYRDQDIVQKFATEQYPEIRYLLYDLFMKMLPADIKKELWDIDEWKREKG